MRREIDMNTYPRKAHFEYFCSLDIPQVGVTANVDVSQIVAFCKQNGHSLYLTVMHAVALAADAVPEFRQRIVDGKLVEYDECPTSHTEGLSDGTYCYCSLRHHMPFSEYIRLANEQREKCRNNPSLKEDGDADSMYFISCLPWLHYTSIVQPTNGTKDSNPRITWGKYEEDFKGRLMMPVTVLCNHAIVDGSHIAAFFDNLNKEMNRIVSDEN